VFSFFLSETSDCADCLRSFSIVLDPVIRSSMAIGYRHWPAIFQPIMAPGAPREGFAGLGRFCLGKCAIVPRAAASAIGGKALSTNLMSASSYDIRARHGPSPWKFCRSRSLIRASPDQTGSHTNRVAAYPLACLT
jgi:hypothetical protein